MVEEINHERRCFLATTIMTIAAAQFCIIGSTAAQTGKTKPASLPPIKPERTSRSARSSRSTPGS